ncbi:MAG: hypothetical protein JW395_3338 [Nitrospira sp.]|nr:hypothetical protein [Nitrospira sp.]
MRISQAVDALERYWELKHPCMLWGPPGSAKTSIVKQFAERNGLEYLPRYLGYYDQTEIRGLPLINDGVSDYADPKWFPRSGKGVIFLDDFVQAPPSVMNVASELLLERRIAEMRLPDGWYVCAAGNPRQYRAGTFEMPSQVRNRLAHINVEPHINDFRDHAEQAGFNQDVIAFLRYRTELLNKWDPVNPAFPTSRTWETVSRIYNDADNGNPIDRVDEFELIGGVIGEPAAVELIAFRRVKSELPSIERILADPKNAPVPGHDKPSAQWAIAMMLANLTTKKNIDAIVEYLGRLPAEFQVLTMRDIQRRDQSLMSTKAFVDWAAKNKSIVL